MMVERRKTSLTYAEVIANAAEEAARRAQADRPDAEHDVGPGRSISEAVEQASETEIRE